MSVEIAGIHSFVILSVLRKGSEHVAYVAAGV